MKVLLLLLALAGIASGLQAPLHYKYKYFGSVFTGIPELDNQAAGWAMKANVEVFIEKDDGVAIFQLHDFKMAEYNGDLGCDVRGEIPDELFHPSEVEALNHAVESPFRVHLFDHDADYVIEHQDEEYHWLTNMRKGVASVFKNEIIRGNIDHQIEDTVAEALHKGNVLNVFSIYEETMFGHCKVHYTVHPIPFQFSGVRDHEIYEKIESDVQASLHAHSLTAKSKVVKKTVQKPAKLVNVPELKDQLWHVVRTVDFDHCDETVALQTTPVGIHEEVTGGQFKWNKGRSSVSEFYFRGGPGHARIEKAIIEGSTTKAPLGLKSELLQARINQTLELVSVTVGDKVPTMPTKTHKSNTWMHEVYSPFETPKESKVHPWVIYTGEKKTKEFQTHGVAHFTPEEIADIKASIIDYVQHAAKILTDMDQEEHTTHTETTVQYLQKSTLLFKHLAKDEILKIFDHFFEKDVHHHETLARKLIIDAATASGTYCAHSAVLEYIKQEKIPELQIITIFMTVTNNAESPLIIHDIMDYIMTLNIKEKPFLAATAFINFAELVENMCVHHHAREIHYEGPIYGDHGCDSTMKTPFLKFLKDIIYSDDTTWEKDIAIETLVTFKSMNTIPILVPLIEGKVKCSPRVRTLAIYGLESWKLPKTGHIREQVLDLLTDVYSDVAEDVEVREAALETVLSWNPEPYFWYKMAKLSWREPSKQFASYVSSIIHTFAHLNEPHYEKQSQAAFHALKFARPIAPTMKYSYAHLRTTHLVNKHVSRFEWISWHSTERAFSPNEFYYFMMTNLGGFDFVNMELHTITEGFFDSFRQIMKKKQEEGGFEGEAAKITNDFYDKIQNTIKAQTVKHDVTPKSDVFLRIFDHMNLFLPLNKETLSKIHLYDPNYLAEIVVQLGLGYDLVLSKFFNPIDMHVAQPTELGLPLFLTTVTPIVISDVSMTHLGLGGKSPTFDSLKKVDLTRESLTTISSEGHSSIQVMLPWNHKFVGTGIRTPREITMPFNLVARTENNDDGGHHNILHVDISSHYKNKFTMVKAASIPYTSITPILPLKSHPKSDIKIIHKSDVKDVTTHLPHTYCGLNFDFKWHSETPFPLSMWSLKELIRHPEYLTASPLLLYSMGTANAKYWEAELHFLPQESETKNIVFEFETGTIAKKEDLQHHHHQQQTMQVQFFPFSGQNDFEVFDHDLQVDQHAQEIEEMKAVDTVHINYDDTKEQRYEKLQEHFGAIAYTKSLMVDFKGDKHRKYEILYSYSKTKINDHKKIKKSHISITRSPIPGVDEESASVCLDVQKTLPIFSELDTVEHLLSANLDKNILAELTLGCQGNSVASLRGTYHLSDEMKKKLQHDIPEACDYDPHHPMYTLHTHAVYDELKYTLTWEKVCDYKHHPLTTKLFDVVEGVMNTGLLKSRCSETEPEHKIEIDAHRCHNTGNWYIDAKREDIEIHLKDIEHNNYFNYMYGIGQKLPEFHPDHVTEFNHESETCAVGLHDVRTFDGFTYEFEPTSCWTVAAEDCHNDHGWMLLVRSPQADTQVPDAKFVHPKRGLTIEYSNHVVKVNGKVVEPAGEQESVVDEHGHVLVVVHKKNGFHMVQFAPDFYVSAKNHMIKVHIPKDMWSDMCGLCGNHDGETESEFIGPHRCYFDNAQKFIAAWTGPSDTCDTATVNEYRKEAEKYQAACHTIETLHSKCPHFNDRCYAIGWMVEKVKDEKICVSESPLAHCDESCEWHHSHPESVEFDCWPVEHAPHQLTEALKNGKHFITEPIMHEPYIYNHHITVSLPHTCKHF